MQALAAALGPKLLLALAQPEPAGVNVDVGVGQGLAGGAVGAFLTTLVVGAIAVAVFPDRTEELMVAVVAEPVESFAYGVLALLGLFVVTLLLVVTVLGIVLAVPLVLVAYVLWAAGSAVAFLAIADRILDRDRDDEGWFVTLLLAAGLNGALAATGVGGLVGLAVGAAGFGAILRPYLG
ncbi:hypothetical protein [Halobacterium rubrum]|uniref:hypothetical protein n=1 Tax=Halobacterium TaxID=2239 RepID=UPI001F3A3085|nr:MULTISPECIES: hypothetical protein [Halobacterium]MDH5019796.1 hypothetical protein [Halobacterium rubrum]